MNDSTRHRPVRTLLPTVAVLSLTAASLAVGFTTAAQAAGEDPRNRNYSIQFMARETSVNMFDEWDYPIDYFFNNDMQAGLSYSYSPGYTGLQAMSLARGGSTNMGPEGAWASSADAYVDSSGIETETDHADGGTVAGLGTYPETWTSVEVNVPADGNPTPFGTDLFTSSATASAFDLDPQPMTGQPGTLDPLDATTATTSAASSRLLAIEGRENRAALEVVNVGGTGTYKALNRTVTIEVVKGAVGTLLNSGDANRVATVEGATVNVTGPDQIVHTFDDSDGYQTLTYEDPTAPDLLLTLTINQNSTFINAFGRSASMWASPVVGSYTNTSTDFQVSKFDIGTLYATTEVPDGGINVAPQPDADNDGLNAFEEAQNFTSDTVPDTDMDGLLDGAEVKVHHTNPKVADTDSDTLSDGLEVTLETDPLLRDTDNDWLDDAREHNTTLTDPKVADTDDDALTDGREATVYGTNPLIEDTDTDGLLDGMEVNVHGTSPLKADTDRDKLTDAREVKKIHTNPLRADTDRDDLRDGVEVSGFPNKRYNKTFTSNPLKADTDKDGLRDRDEVTGARNNKFRNARTNPRRQDTDHDGFPDLREIKARSNPAQKRSTPRHP